MLPSQGCHFSQNTKRTLPSSGPDYKALLKKFQIHLHLKRKWGRGVGLKEIDSHPACKASPELQWLPILQVPVARGGRESSVTTKKSAVVR